MVNNLHGGGAEKVLQTALQHLDYSRFDVTLYCVHQTTLPDSLQGKVRLRHIFSHGIGCKNTAFNRLRTKIGNKLKLLVYEHMSPRWFYRLFVHGSYDVEVSFIEGYSTRIVAGSTNHRSRKLAWVHIDVSQNHWSKIAYRSFEEECRCYTRFDCVPCVSDVVRDSARSLFGVGNAAVTIYNPLDERSIIEAAKCEVPGMSRSKAFRFITLGRLDEQKGYDRLIPVMAHLRDKGCDVELWILGEGQQRPLLEQLTDKYGLRECVRLLGFQSNPYAYMQYCDAFVCSSRAEGYSTAICESLILGLPVVTTLCSGSREILGENDEYGIVTANDSAALEEGMERMMQPDVAAHYRAAAAERGKRFRIDELMRHFQDILDV